MVLPDVFAACAAEEGVVGGHLGQHLVHAVPELHPPPGLHSDCCWARVTVSSGGGCVGRRLAPWCWMLGPSQGQPSLAPASTAMCKSLQLLSQLWGQSALWAANKMQDAQHAWSVVSKYYCICLLELTILFPEYHILCISISMVCLKLRALFIVSFSLLSRRIIIHSIIHQFEVHTLCNIH